MAVVLVCGSYTKLKTPCNGYLCCDMWCGDLHAIKTPCHECLCCDMWCGDLHALRYHAMNTYALKYGAVIYMLSFTCRRLLAAHSGTREEIVRTKGKGRILALARQVIKPTLHCLFSQ